MTNPLRHPTTMEPEEEKIETPVEAPAELSLDAADAAAPEEERKPTPMPKPKELKILLLVLL